MFNRPWNCGKGLALSSVLITALAITLACGGGGGSSSNATPTAPTKVHGTSILRHLPFSWTTHTLGTDSAPNASSLAIGALVPAAGGGFTTVAGTYNATDGTFSVNHVPSGPYWLTFGSSDYIWTDKSQVDLGWNIGGRKDVTAATASPTNIVFSTTGMDPWTSSDYLQFFDFNARLYEMPNWDASVNWPIDGDTSLNSLTVDWANSGGISYPLADTAKGDHPQLIQMASKPLGVETYQVASKVYAPSSLTMTNGAGASVGGTFGAMPGASINFAFNWKRSEFAQHQPAVNPTATTLYGEFYLDCQPGFAQYGFINAMDLLYYFNSGDLTDLNAGTVQVPAPPQGFDLFTYAIMIFRKSYLLPGTTVASRQYAFIQSINNTLPTSTSPVRPLVSPVLNPQLGGQSLFSDPTAVGLTPTLSWTAPATGTPTGTVIYVRELFANGSTTTTIPVARIYTSTNSVQLPPGVLQSGKTYNLLIRTYASPGWDPSAAPFQAHPGSMGWADTLSGIITP
ncbi:MAG TPA: hypothetical protein VJ486_03045 [Geothrix sp.]|nr:hypothetical protein [Geothrix sp.]